MMPQVSVHFADKTLAGVPSLLDDLQKLCEDKDTADVIFIVGREEASLFAHKLILLARCKNLKQLRFEQRGNTGSLNKPVSIRYPHFASEVFREVLYYIYTGKIILHEQTVFSVLHVAKELGVAALQRSCEEHILSTLSVHNACSYLTSAMQLDLNNRPSEFTTDCSFSDMCAQFIEQNAEECVKTDGWRHLPQHVLTKLLSSDNFSLEEEDVWRAVLIWAKCQAGLPLDKMPAHCNENEKFVLCQHLSEVIHHVKLLLIDSAVFAEEVEPTGAVPMELSLERYRYAAFPTKFSSSADSRLRPRANFKLFHGTEILTKEKLQYQRLLNSWYGDSKQCWELLYRSSRDGYTADSFHQLCDGHSPTFIIILGTTGSICGGFSDAPWTSKTPERGKYIASEKSFLFTLLNNQGVPPTKFTVTKPMFATLHHPNFGPCFGGGADLCITNNSHAGMECYSNMPHSYHGDNASCSILMGDYNFNILDYEVFTIKE